jgi:hypothetical protein
VISTEEAQHFGVARNRWRPLPLVLFFSEEEERMGLVNLQQRREMAERYIPRHDVPWDMTAPPREASEAVEVPLLLSAFVPVWLPEMPGLRPRRQEVVIRRLSRTPNRRATRDYAAYDLYPKSLAVN